MRPWRMTYTRNPGEEFPLIRYFYGNPKKSPRSEAKATFREIDPQKRPKVAELVDGTWEPR